MVDQTAGARSAPSAVIFGCDGLSVSPDEAQFFRDADPFGFILFGRNVGDADQLRRLTSDLRAAVGRDAPILIDQEGGRVARIRPPLGRAWSAVGDWCDRVDRPDGGWSEADLGEALRLRYRLIASELLDFGVDVDCAPVLDLRLPGADRVVGDRALGATPAHVATRGQAVFDGLSAGGVTPVIKHMPGHGRAEVDSHDAAPLVGADLRTLAADFEAFAAFGDAPFGMTAHVIFAAVDEDMVATLSPTVISGVIRDRIGFQGALMSDDLGMGALQGSIAKRAGDALDAGCDLALICNAPLAERQAAMTEIPRLSGRPLARCDAARAARRPPEPFDPAHAEARLRALGAPGW